MIFDGSILRKPRENSPAPQRAKFALEGIFEKRFVGFKCYNPENVDWSLIKAVVALSDVFDRQICEKARNTVPDGVEIHRIFERIYFSLKYAISNFVSIIIVTFSRHLHTGYF